MERGNKSIMNRKFFPILCLMLILIYPCFSCFGKIEAKAASHPIIFIGDSRTEGMAASLTDKQKKNVVFYAATSQGYSWLSDEVVSKVTTKLYTYPHVDFKVVISLGINDHNGNIEKYVSLYNELAKNEWAGFDIYIVSIGPVDEAKMRSTSRYPQTNKSILSSNLYLRRNLKADNLHYVNLYHRMINDAGTGVKPEFETVADGAHYTYDSNRLIWKYIKRRLKKA